MINYILFTLVRHSIVYEDSIDTASELQIIYMATFYTIYYFNYMYVHINKNFHSKYLILA